MRVALAVAILALALAAGPSSPVAAQQDDLLAARTHGSPTAPVTVYEISDFQCPFCARFFLETMPSLEREYVVPGRVKFVFVNFPLPMHPNAVPAAELAMCAARQGKFWPMHDILFRHQQQWAGLSEPGTVFLSYGDSVGANPGGPDLLRPRRDDAQRRARRRRGGGALRRALHAELLHRGRAHRGRSAG